MDFPEFVNRFIALLVVTNPLSALPAVLKITRNQTIAEKRHTGLVSAFAAGIILLVSIWIGKPLLLILGIQLPAFQVAGGFVLFLMAVSMLNAEESPIKQTAEEQKEKQSDLGAIVPLAIPIMAGPGAISSVILSVNVFPGLANQFLLSLIAILVAFALGILLYFASNMEKMMGKSGINIVNRLGGLLLAAIAVQTMANGVKGLFPLLGSTIIP
jgi:multiple antibiotic resistance protein